MVIRIETDWALYAGALIAAGCQVFAVNPPSVSRYWERHSVSGAKSDPGVARALATWSAPTGITTATWSRTVTWPRQ